MKKNPELYERILALAKARTESIEEIANTLGISTATVRSYKSVRDREPRPRLLRRLEELEGLLLGGQSKHREVRESLTSTEYSRDTWSKPFPEVQSPMQRITIIQNLAELNRIDILAIKQTIEKLVEVISDLKENRPAEKKRGT